MTRFTINPSARNAKRFLVQQVTEKSIRSVGNTLAGYDYDEALTALETLAAENNWKQINDTTWEV